MDKYFGGVIWTNHILERMNERGLSQKDVLWAFNHSDKSITANNPGAYRFFRDYHGNRIEVVAKKGQDGRWILMSCWSKPIYQYKTELNKSQFLWGIPKILINALLGK